MAFKTTGGQTYTLANSIGSTDTTIRLNSFQEPISNTPYTMAIIGSTIVYGTIAPKTGQSEFISFTGITQNSDGTADLTGVTRGIGRSYPYTASSTFRLPHQGQSIFILSDAPTVFNKYGVLSDAEVITNYWEGLAPITAMGLVTRDYMLALINGGAITTDALVEAGTAGETVSAGQVLYLKAADGRWWKANASTAATVNSIQLGIAKGAGTAGNAITGGVLRRGLDSNQSGGSAGALGYIPNGGGTISTTTGTTEKVVGNFLTATTFIFDPDFYYVPTVAIKAASAGTQGTPGSANKFVTSDNTSASEVDQSQTTQNATIAVGVADTTGLANKLSQSFIPTLTKMSGAKLYKSADTGTFTGTVKVALQADTTGSPSGSDLASVTITNAVWLNIAVGEFDAIFSTEYGTLVPGDTYWIVVTISTSDNSNHPNLGDNSAGGYANGSVKRFNTTDGWVAVATVDLYFKTINGIVSQIIKTTTAGVLPIQMFQQRDKVYVYNGTKTNNAATSTVIITHALGVYPSYIRVTAAVTVAAAAANVGTSNGIVTIANNGGTVTYSGYFVRDTTTTSAVQTLAAVGALYTSEGSGDPGQLGTITNVGTQTLNLVLTKVGAPGANAMFYTLEIYA